MQTHNWPWWVYCHTEATHWSGKWLGHDVQGGQSDGAWWRMARHEWLEGTWGGGKVAIPATREERERALIVYEEP